MRILIIAHDFPPVNRVASLRPYAWAKYWHQMGHEIGVLTTRKDAFRAPLDLQTEYRSLQGVRLEEVPYVPLKSRSFNPHPESTPPALPPSSIGKSSYQVARTWLRRFSEFLGTGSFLYASSLWIVPALKRAQALYPYWPFEVVVSTFGPPAAHIIAGALKRQFNIFWVADYRDLWFGSHLVTAKWPFSWLEQSLEDYVVSQADLITTVSDPLQSALQQRFPQPVLTIANGFDPEDGEGFPPDPFPSNGKIRLAYTGLLYPGKQDLSLLWQAIDRLRAEGFPVADKLEILLYGPDFSSLTPAIVAHDLQAIVKIAGFVPRSEALQVQRWVDALIFLDWDVPQVSGILTGKLFEYLFSGRPILGIGVTPDTAAGQLLESTRTGFLIGKSVDRMAELLQQLLRGEGLPYAPDRAVLQQYTRETLARTLLEQITERRAEGEFRSQKPGEALNS
ncbi:hypothetical protein BST81_15755 [Leptolyngbya sp. 'hensonii']|uniref:glycosyltransferase n=1 Tax=Leptolyngbya sp. 'hensonii' TaxID=1922337 RepID=UPI00094F9D4F|nr:glycosyltransferase [Leptolyngbya sp. 'hensonii']OLP17273.1 hypothetical protein BST81_15755 [Leptolyngbya sp. 'hensonii']